MIVIMGSTHDDVIYYESILSDKRESWIYAKYPAIFGKILNQEACLVYDVYTSYSSEAVAMYFIRNFFVVLILSVGTVRSYSKDVQFGDVVVSKEILLGDVDQTPVRNVKLGQVPGFETTLEIGRDVLSFLVPNISTVTFSKYRLASFISSNTFYVRKDQLRDISLSGRAFGLDSNVVLDSTSGGVAIACELTHTSFAAVKSVEGAIGETMSVEDYGKILDSYSLVGRAIVTCIGDIGRTDVLERGKVE